MDSSVPLMNHDLSDLGSVILIQITPEEHASGLQILHSPDFSPGFGQ